MMSPPNDNVYYKSADQQYLRNEKIKSHQTLLPSSPLNLVMMIEIRNIVQLY